jgi:hypothetical protein
MNRFINLPFTNSIHCNASDDPMEIVTAGRDRAAGCFVNLPDDTSAAARGDWD